MVLIRYEEILKLAEQLPETEQNKLIAQLCMRQNRKHSPTREELLHDVELLRKTPVHPGDGLLGKYANPNVPEISEEEFHAQMYAMATEWEQELDEFYDDKS